MINARGFASDTESVGKPVCIVRSTAVKAFVFIPKGAIHIARLSAAVCVTVALFLIGCPVFARNMQPAGLGAARYVSAQGSDSKDGLSWGTAKNTISAAVLSCPTFGRCTINVSSMKLSSALFVNRPNTTIQCASGAVISTDVENGAPVTVRADGFELTGCTFEYSSGVAETVVAIPHAVSHVVISQNVFRNYRGHPAYFGIIHVGNRTNKTAETAVTDVRITGNRFLNIDPDAINLQDNVFRITISHNVFVSDLSRSNSPTINAQASDPGTTLESISITNNSISKGTSNNCVQVQNLAFQHSTIRNVTVSGNTCRLQPRAGAGAGATGYSMVGILGLVESGNTFEGNSQEISGNAPFEVVSCQRANISRNTARMGTVSRNVNAFTLIGTRFALTSKVSLEGNAVFMSVRRANFATCYDVSAGQNARLEQVTLSGNSCNLSGSTASGVLRGIWVQTFAKGASIRGGTISGNVIVGAQGKTVIGIHLEKDAGEISGLQVVQNHFTNTKRDVVGAGQVK